MIRWRHGLFSSLLCAYVGFQFNQGKGRGLTSLIFAQLLPVGSVAVSSILLLPVQSVGLLIKFGMGNYGIYE
jgi:hypothetical protein